MTIPNQYNISMPYMIVENAAAFVAFMKFVFGATDQLLVPRDEALIMHAELRVGDAVIMLADATADYPVCNSATYIYVADVEQVYYHALEAESKSLMPIANREYGKSAGFKDPFGNTWWLAEGGK